MTKFLISEFFCKLLSVNVLGLISEASSILLLNYLKNAYDLALLFPSDGTPEG